MTEADAKLSKQHITILMAAYNCEQWLEKSVMSAVRQDYPNFEIVLVDPCSTDRTFSIAQALAAKYPVLRPIRPNRRTYQVETYVDAIRELERDDTVIVLLDGDDWFRHDDVLNVVNDNYSKGDVWLTYGTYAEHPYRDVSWHYEAYPEEVIRTNNFRAHKWLGSHLRTFRRKLFLSIRDEDLRDIDGEYVKMAGDLAFMFPMLEMAAERSRYIREILYVYNMTNPLSEFRIDAANQERLDKLNRARRKYSRLETLEPAAEQIPSVANA